MNKPALAALAATAAALLAAGCAAPNFAFDVGQPEHYRIDRGKEGSVLITRQKKMSFGFLPATAEMHRRPPESVAPVIGWDHMGDGKFMRDNREPLVRYMLWGIVATPVSLLVTPWYGDYSCDSHYWMHNNVEMVSAFPQDVQDTLKVKTWKDGGGGRDWGAIMAAGHASWLGFHRYATVVVEEIDEGEERSVYETP